MTLNISIDAQDVSLWTLVKLFLKVSVALMPAVVIWIVVPTVVSMWMMMVQQMFRHG
jgi:hypothetical protein